MRIPFNVAACAFLLLSTSGCTSNVAQIFREWGPGPVAADREQPVIVEQADEGTRSIGLPLLADVPVPGYMGRCTVYAAWIDPAVRDSLLQIDRDSVPPTPPFLPGISFFTVQAPPVFFEPERVREARPMLTAPDPPVFDRDEVDPFTGSLLVELWLEPEEEMVSRECDQPAPSPDAQPPNRYLIDFGTIRPVGGVAMGGGAFIIGVVGLTGLLALVLGG